MLKYIIIILIWIPVGICIAHFLYDDLPEIISGSKLFDKKNDKAKKCKNDDIEIIILTSKKDIDKARKYYDKINTCPDCGAHEIKKISKVYDPISEYDYSLTAPKMAKMHVKHIICKCKSCGCVYKYKVVPKYEEMLKKEWNEKGNWSEGE